MPMGAAADAGCLGADSADTSSLPIPACLDHRACDSCFGCATHAMPGKMTMVMTIRDKDGNTLEEPRRD